MSTCNHVGQPLECHVLKAYTHSQLTELHCYDPLCPAHPACSPYTGHMEGAGCGPTTSIMSGDYPHLVPGYKSTATSDGGPFSASATLTHTFDKRSYSRTYPLHASTHLWKPLDF